jgi:putative methyltransferase (TIGR04325 family)
MYRGRYKTWVEAKSHAGAYDAPQILAKVLAGALAVKTGHAAFERDSFTFSKHELNGPLISALGYVAGSTDGNLRVLDFGGSLGSSYWQSRPYLSPKISLAWDVVEQPNFIAAGRQHFSDTPLRFFNTIQEAEAVLPHDVLVASGVIQYLENPDWLLDQAKGSSCPFVILTRTPIQETGSDYVAIQHVPPSLYQATYPVWLFDRQTMLHRLNDHYELIFDLDLQRADRDGVRNVLWFLKKRR